LADAIEDFFEREFNNLRSQTTIDYAFAGSVS
jgi:hypothetical protein